MTEAEFQALVMAESRSRGLLAFHSTDSRRDVGKGFPDTVIVGRRVLFRELKVGGARPEGDQIAWKWALLAAGADWAVWYDRDLSEIRTELDSLCRPAPSERLTCAGSP